MFNTGAQRRFVILPLGSPPQKPSRDSVSNLYCLKGTRAASSNGSFEGVVSAKRSSAALEEVTGAE